MKTILISFPSGIGTIAPCILESRVGKGLGSIEKGRVGQSSDTRGSGFRVQGSGFRVQGSGFRVQGSGLRVQGSGFKVHDSGMGGGGTRRCISRRSSILAFSRNRSSSTCKCLYLLARFPCSLLRRDCMWNVLPTALASNKVSLCRTNMLRIESCFRQASLRGYRRTSPIRKHTPSWDHPRTLSIDLR